MALKLLEQRNKRKIKLGTREQKLRLGNREYQNRKKCFQGTRELCWEQGNTGKLFLGTREHGHPGGPLLITQTTQRIGRPNISPDKRIPKHSDNNSLPPLSPQYRKIPITRPPRRKQQKLDKNKTKQNKKPEQTNKQTNETK